MSFGKAMKRLRDRSSKSKYRLSQYSGIDQAYIHRLETGQKTNPSREVVMKLSLALVEGTDAISIHDIDELLLSAGYAPLSMGENRLNTRQG